MSKSFTPSKRLAIVVPLFNPGQFLQEILANLRTCAEAARVSIDIFLADDGNQNSLGENGIAGEHNWGRVSYWQNSRNLGETQNVNNAFKRVQELGYEFALLLHQDDLASPAWLHYCAERADDQDDSHGQFWFCDCLSVEIEDSKDLPTQYFNDTPVGVDSENVIRRQGAAAIESFYREFAWGPSGTLFHLPSFFEIGGFHSLLRYCADGDFGVRWLCAGFTMNQVKHAYCYRRLHPNQTTKTGVISGIADQGYAYIMVRYHELAGLKRRFREHAVWARRRFGTAFDCMKAPSLKCAAMHVAAFRIIFGSLMSCCSPRFVWLLPKSVRVLLDCAPPVTFPPRT